MVASAQFWSLACVTVGYGPFPSGDDPLAAIPFGIVFVLSQRNFKPGVEHRRRRL
ncbi:MAG TPA: hypothetical protein VNG11_02360 [Chloroflexota bacterium]|nr:hypothetical protein [Chloroflexota bacterium]